MIKSNRAHAPNGVKEVKEMEIYERKNTTRFAVEQLEKLFVSLNEHLEDDIGNFNGAKEFFAIVVHDNGFMTGDFNRKEWKTDRAKIGYRNGEFCLICYISKLNERYRDYYKIDSDEFWRIKKINFADMFSALVEAVEIYNEKSKKKDEQIEHFLEIAKQF
jgi:hypothetical protein